MPSKFSFSAGECTTGTRGNRNLFCTGGDEAIKIDFAEAYDIANFDPWKIPPADGLCAHPQRGRDLIDGKEFGGGGGGCGEGGRGGGDGAFTLDTPGLYALHP